MAAGVILAKYKMSNFPLAFRAMLVVSSNKIESAAFRGCEKSGVGGLDFNNKKRVKSNSRYEIE